MEIPTLVRCHLCIEMAPGAYINVNMQSYQYKKSHHGNDVLLNLSYFCSVIFCSGKVTIFTLKGQLHMSLIILFKLNPEKKYDIIVVKKCCHIC